MDPKILASVINTSSGRCWASEINNPVPGAIEKSPSNDDYQVRDNNTSLGTPKVGILSFNHTRIRIAEGGDQEC